MSTEHPLAGYLSDANHKLSQDIADLLTQYKKATGLVPVVLVQPLHARFSEDPDLRVSVSAAHLMERVELNLKQI